MSKHVVEAGTREWRRMITASKIPVILGLSPWQSQFALWHEMRDDVEPEPFDDEVDRRGHLAELMLGPWWEQENPDWVLDKRGEDHEQPFTNEDLPFPNQVLCDYTATGPDGERTIIECKTTTELDTWADADGNPAIPAHYAAQVIFQMGVSGIHRAELIVMGAFFTVETYAVEWDEEVWETMVARCEEWWRSLEEDTPPELDDTTATLKTLRKLHHDIERGLEVEIDPHMAMKILAARKALDDADKKMTAYQIVCLDLMENAQKLVCGGEKIADRRKGAHGVNFVVNRKAKVSDGE